MTLTISPRDDIPRIEEPAGEGRSRIWVMIRESDNVMRYVRGDRVVEVQRLSYPHGQCQVTVAINDSLDGGYGTRRLWDLPDEVTAGNAALALMQILNSGCSGLVVLSNDTHRPQLVPFTLDIEGIS